MIKGTSNQRTAVASEPPVVAVEWRGGVLDPWPVEQILGVEEVQVPVLRGPYPPHTLLSDHSIVVSTHRAADAAAACRGAACNFHPPGKASGVVV